MQFLLFKAKFTTKHKNLIQQGRNLDFMNKLNYWLDQNIENLFEDFINSKPS